MNDRPTSPRIPWIAATLSLFCTGLGHVYCGRIRRGVVLFLLALTFVPVSFGIAWLSPSDGLLTLLLASLLFVVPVYLFAVVDAVRIAGHRMGGVGLTGWNSPAVYALGIVIGLAAPVLGMVVVRHVAFEAYFCPTRSMEPTIRTGDRVLVNKLAFSLREVRRGELVVFRNPQNRRQAYIKRVIGLPGDRIEEKADIPEMIVPEGTYFVLGDARENSRDSRHFGCVPEEDLIGPVQYVYFPPSRFGHFGD
jgi:signal peptidase I